MNINSLVIDFLQEISLKKIEIYNEASLQYELAIFLRHKLPMYFIQLERNISFFDLDKKKFKKKEIDIVIYSKDRKEKLAIELKCPLNGQCPEQMFSFCKDIRFLEELKYSGFSQNIFLVVTSDKKFWQGKPNNNPIYAFFRDNKVLCGSITKPTGLKDKVITLNGKYNIKWLNLTENLKYSILFI